MTTALRPHDSRSRAAIGPGLPAERRPRAGRGRWWLAAALAVAGTLAAVATQADGAPAAGPLALALGDGETGQMEGDGRVEGLDLTVEDTWHAAVGNLDPGLRDAVAAASEDARAEGVEVLVRSGWRSRDYQQELLDDAVQEYGSLDEALRWVATPDASRHVVGAAVDLGPTDAAYWMAEHGAAYGLCQAYANEIWHYELLTAPGGTCPEPRADGAS